ncbi:uncharacterized protein AMSG_07642 [Thecamonas trahens ATCC 50062]|uniref:PH domain-containing protein n=1 Tax=Thecamonas trahens ATCC 50062 TaxID=461836 RepID=A0A0L0DGI7_THETB|nr:hypothetical protein AMSG_07642 [Thecamonas trahens ATCC 50062]KNC51447.1 hypothetical protein AMSG_07642 [Thecamonas trahens ATCC 50062]|eukprot:XP_013756109.1 hypothetical protein AMSG_07642 [Thecamonas trahens ATCC 50062]
MAFRLWSAEEVGAWLESLGYGEYGQAFVENEVDGEALEGLDTEMLKEMGLVKVGPRAKVLRAVRELVAEAAEAAAAASEDVGGKKKGKAKKGKDKSKSKSKGKGKSEAVDQSAAAVAIVEAANGTASAISKQGWLTKEGGKRKNWKQRWFTLENMVLSYYKAEADVGVKNPLGRIPIPSYEVDLDNKKPFGFKISHPGCRTYYFGAESEAERQLWMKAIREQGLATASKTWFNAEANFFSVEYAPSLDLFEVAMTMDAPEESVRLVPGKTYRYHAKLRRSDGYSEVLLDATKTGIVVRDVTATDKLSTHHYTALQRYTIAAHDPVFSILEVKAGLKSVFSFHMGNFAIARHLNSVVTAHIGELVGVIRSMR